MTIRTFHGAILAAAFLGGTIALAGCQNQGNQGGAAAPSAGDDALQAGYRTPDQEPYVPGRGDWSTDPATDPASFRHTWQPANQTDQQQDANLARQAEAAHRAAASQPQTGPEP